MDEPMRATARAASPALDGPPAVGRSRSRSRSRARGTTPARGEARAQRRARAELPRGDTRERIQAIALELFAEHGYEKTSLREIAERLGVTKAALYYHFKSKEDIVRSFTEDYRAELDTVIAWGASQPPTPETRAEILARYADIVSRRLEVIRFMEQNQATLHSLLSDLGREKKLFREHFRALCDLITPPGADLPGRIRAAVAVVSIGMSSLLFQREASPEEVHDAAIEVACDLAGVPVPDPARGGLSGQSLAGAGG